MRSRSLHRPAIRTTVLTTSGRQTSSARRPPIPATSSLTLPTRQPERFPSKASNLSIRKGDMLTVRGTGWTPGLLIIITICSADASNVSPLVQLEEFDFTPDACEPVTLSLGSGWKLRQGQVVGSESWGLHLDRDAHSRTARPNVGSPLAECPQDQTQATQGVNCIVGAAELVGLSSDGNTADAPIFFAPPALGSSDVWQGGLGTSARIRRHAERHRCVYR